MARVHRLPQQLKEVPEDTQKLLKDKGLASSEIVLAYYLIVLYPLPVLKDIVEKDQKVEFSHSFLLRKFDLYPKSLYNMAERLISRGLLTKRSLPCRTGSHNVYYSVVPNKLLNLFTPDN